MLWAQLQGNCGWWSCCSQSMVTHQEWHSQTSSYMIAENLSHLDPIWGTTRVYMTRPSFLSCL
jgi:hypothetical protein